MSKPEVVVEFTTTITHRVSLSRKTVLDISHGVEVNAGDAVAFGEAGVYRIAKAGCAAAINALDAQLVAVALREEADQIPGLHAVPSEEQAVSGNEEENPNG